MNDDRINKDLDQWASAFKTKPLKANVPNRDQLMFACGQAAGRQSVQEVALPKSYAIQTIRQALVITCSICLGATLMHWNSPSVAIETQSQQIVQETRIPPLPQELSSQQQPNLSATQLAAIQSGHILHASSQLMTASSYQQSAHGSPLAPDKPIYRAGMLNRIDLIQ